MFMETNYTKTSENIEAEIKKELCRHVPKCVLKILDKGAQNVYEYPMLILLLADVTGFTAMTELYCTGARKGINDLTNALNAYMSKIIQCVFSYEGQIFKFAGDAILCIWEVEDTKDICVKLKAMQALQCAFILQQDCSFYKLKKEITLNVKTFISIGAATLVKLQNENLTQHLIIGKPVEELKNICHCDEVQQVVMTSTFWNVLKSDIVLKGGVKNGLHDGVMKIKITDLQRGILNATKFSILHNCSKFKTDDSKKIKTEDLANFVIKPVREKIKQVEPLCYLCEMRNVTISFINVELQHYTIDVQSSLQKMFDFVEKTVRSHGGTFMKMLAFDKGLSFLNVFGIKEINENKAVNALESSYDILNEFNKYEYIKLCSIGVSTGLTYCGVVGHEKRHEYTCIGSKVNMSARLMCSYLGIVSCDEETYLTSKLNSSCFKQLEKKTLKGILSTGNIYWYFQKAKEISAESENAPITFILGRQKEIACVAAQITIFMNEKENAKKKCLLFEGADGIGKSKLISHIFRVLKTKSNWKLIFIQCRRFRKREIFSGIKVILSHLLDLESIPNEDKAEIVDKLKTEDVTIQSSLHRLILADIFDIRSNDSLESTFLQTESCNYISAMKLVVKSIFKLTNKKIVLLIDDIHYMDKESLSIIQQIGEDENLLIVATSQTINNISHDETLLDVMYQWTSKRNQVIHYRLNGLSKSDLRLLINYEIRINHMENDLIEMLYEKTNGIPGVCKEAIAELIRFKIINLIDITNNKCDGVVIDEVPSWKKNLLTDIFVNRRKIEDFIEKNKKYAINYIRRADEIDIPISIESFFLRQFDRLDDTSKNLLLNTSILGETFSRKYMLGMCKSVIVRKNFNLAVKDLLENELLKCANNHTRKNWFDYSVTCKCPGNVTNIPFMCKMLQFSHAFAKAVLVESMTDEAKTLRHKTAVEWLEIQSSSHNWYLCSINEANIISVEENYYSEQNSNPIFEIVDQMRLKNVEEKACSMDATAHDNGNHFVMKSMSKSKWFVAKENIMLEKIKSNNKFYADIFRKIASASKYKLGAVFRSIDAINSTVIHMNFVSFSDVEKDRLKSRINILIDMHNERNNLELTRNVYVNNSNNLSTDNYARALKACDSFEYKVRSNCHCEKILIRIYEEILFHSGILNDNNRYIFYTIKEAELLLKMGRSIRAGRIINKLKAEFEALNNISRVLLGHYFNLLGQFYYFASCDNAKAFQSMLRCLNILGLQSPRTMKAEKLQKYTYEKTKTGIDLLISTLKILILSSENLGNSIFWKDIRDILRILISNNRYYSFEAAIILIHLLYRLHDLNHALEVCTCCLNMSVKMDKIMVIYIGCFYTISAYIRLNKGNVECAYLCFQKAQMIFEKMESTRHLMFLFPYFAFTLIFTERKEELSGLLDSVYEKICNTNDKEKSRWINCYWCVCLDLNETFGVKIQYNGEKLLHFAAEHTNILEKINAEIQQYTGMFYALTTVAKMYCHRNDRSNALRFLLKAFRFMNETLFDNDDFLIQRCLLNVAECQVQILGLEVDYSLNYNTELYIDQINCIDENSLHYPLFCLLKAYVLRVRGFCLDSTNIMKKAIEIARKLDMKMTVDLLIANLYDWEIYRNIKLILNHPS